MDKRKPTYAVASVSTANGGVAKGPGSWSAAF